MTLEQILKGNPAKAVAAGLIAGALYLAGTVSRNKPEAKKSHQVEFQDIGVQIVDSLVPKQIVFEDEKTYRKFANLASDIQEAYKDELKVRGLKGFGQRETYQIVQKIGRNTPYEEITAEEVDKAVYLWQKEGRKAFDIKMKTPSRTNPNCSSIYWFEHNEDGHYLVISADFRQRIKVENSEKTARYILDMQKHDPVLNGDYYTGENILSLAEALMALDNSNGNEEITDTDIETASRIKGGLLGIQHAVQYGIK